MKKKSWYRPLVVMGLLLAVLAFAGCSGDDGDNGKNGKSAYQIAVDNGFVGTEQDWLASLEGEDADPAVTDDLQDQIDDIGDILFEESLPAHYQTSAHALDVAITVQSVTNVGGKLQVAVNLKGSDNKAVPADAFEARRLTFMLADLVPAGTDTGASGTWDTAYFKRWASENLTTAGAVVDNSDAANGNYVFTFNSSLSALGGATYPYTSASHSQRLAVYWRPLNAYDYNRAATVFDFNVPAAGAAAVELASQRVLAPSEGCVKCHTENMEKAAHASSYRDTRVCVVCHSPLYSTGMLEDGVYLTNFIHKIHAALEVEAFDDRILGNGYVDVTYPREIQDCAVCHTGADNMTDAWKTNPTMEACGSCHEEVDFATGENHGGGAQPDNGGCVYCHPASGEGYGQSVAGAHQIEDTLNYTSTVMVSADDDASPNVYEPGDQILVTVTTSNYAAGDYIVDGKTRTANLYVYGPRALAVPVLTTGSTTDTVTPQTPPTQGHSMLITSTDPLVRTDAQGFKYQLLPIPEDLAPGTYMVMAYVTTNLEDCSAIYRGSVCVDGWALTNIQIGTDEPELKVAGDNCTNCHNQSQWGAYYHRSYFGTDGCLACHDESGNHADPIANRVHAVHSANTYGDFVLGIEDGETDIWEGVTYPQNLNCQTCHSSGNTSYKETMWTLACIGCHGEASGANLLHMNTMSEEEDGMAGSGSCATCHGAGKAFDISD